MKSFTVTTTKPKEVIDITDMCNQYITEDASLGHIFVAHTTCALTTADLDPGTDLDMLDAFEELIPKLEYRHPHDPGHVSDHILSTLIGTSLVVPVENGKFVLGTWQRIVLFEFNGPKERQLFHTNI